MTPTPDTSPEAVDAMIENLGKRGRKTGWLANPDGPEAAAMLRAVASERDAWRNTLIDEAVTCWIYRVEHDSDPLLTLREVIAWNVQVALDPKVSEDARKLIAAAEAEAAALREALGEIEALEIDWRLSTAENMRAASDVARRAIKENHDGL